MTRYFMVTVAQTVEFSYPVAADDEEAAREKVVSLLGSCKVPAPLGIAVSPATGDVDVRDDPVETEPLPCSQVAAQAFTARQRAYLLGEEGASVGTMPTASTPARVALTAFFPLRESLQAVIFPPVWKTDTSLGLFHFLHG